MHSNSGSNLPPMLGRRNNSDSSRGVDSAGPRQPSCSPFSGTRALHFTPALEHEDEDVDDETQASPPPLVPAAAPKGSSPPPQRRSLRQRRQLSIGDKRKPDDADLDEMDEMDETQLGNIASRDPFDEEDEGEDEVGSDRQDGDSRSGSPPLAAYLDDALSSAGASPPSGGIEDMSSGTCSPSGSPTTASGRRSHNQRVVRPRVIKTNVAADFARRELAAGMASSPSSRTSSPPASGPMQYDAGSGGSSPAAAVPMAMGGAPAAAATQSSSSGASATKPPRTRRRSSAGCTASAIGGNVPPMNRRRSLSGAQQRSSRRRSKGAVELTNAVRAAAAEAPGAGVGPDHSGSPPVSRRLSALRLPVQSTGSDASAASSSHMTYSSAMASVVSDHHHQQPPSRPSQRLSQQTGQSLGASGLQSTSAAGSHSHVATLIAAATQNMGDVRDMPLPPHWEEAMTEDGRFYYVNHATQTTTWTDPRLALRQAAVERLSRALTSAQFSPQSSASSQSATSPAHATLDLAADDAILGHLTGLNDADTLDIGAIMSSITGAAAAASQPTDDDDLFALASSIPLPPITESLLASQQPDRPLSASIHLHHTSASYRAHESEFEFDDILSDLQSVVSANVRNSSPASPASHSPLSVPPSKKRDPADRAFDAASIDGESVHNRRVSLDLGTLSLASPPQSANRRQSVSMEAGSAFPAFNGPSADDRRRSSATIHGQSLLSEPIAENPHPSFADDEHVFDDMHLATPADDPATLDSLLAMF